MLRNMLQSQILQHRRRCHQPSGELKNFHQPTLQTACCKEERLPKEFVANRLHRLPQTPRRNGRIQYTVGYRTDADFISRFGKMEIVVWQDLFMHQLGTEAH